VFLFAEVWEELKPTQTSAEELTVVQFLNRIGLEKAEQSLTAATGGASVAWPILSEFNHQIVHYIFSMRVGCSVVLELPTITVQIIRTSAE